MAFEPGRGNNPRHGQSFEEVVESLVEWGWHIFQDEAWDPVRARCLMVRDRAESLLHYSRGYFPEIVGTEGVGDDWT